MKMTPNFAPLDPSDLAGDFAAQIREMIANAKLNPGDKLPSSRKLSAELGVSRGTVIVGLEALIAEGFLETNRGSGTFVAKRLTASPFRQTSDFAPPLGRAVSPPEVDHASTKPLNFLACRPSLEAFPRSAWKKAIGEAAAQLPEADYGDPQGELELRIAIASYLCRARGMDVDPDQILVTNGAIQAMQLVSELYLDHSESFAMEEPGYPLARQVFRGSGASAFSLDVDLDGINIDRLEDCQAAPKIIYTTPSHQFPTGARLSLDRRQHLVEWARKNDALILEDDYDGEFRYDVAPLPPMAAMAEDGFVLYLGTFSKTLFPSLRIGYAAGDREIIRKLTSLRAKQDYQSNSVMQIGLAKFISRGDFERHVHKMRRIYSKKRSALQSAVREFGIAGELTGVESGLNAMLKLDTDLSAANIAARAELRGMSVSPISRYRASRSKADDALVLGYAACSENEIRQGIGILADLLET